MTAPTPMVATRAEALFRNRDGPWAVVTGPTDGIGRAFADCLAQRRLNLVLVARRGAILDEMADRYASEHGIDTRVLVADLSEPGGPDALADITSALDVGLVVAAVIADDLR